jgi:hypothetical protein
VLAHDGLIRDTKLPVKVLGAGDAPNGITVHAHAFSRTALDKLTAAGCTVQRLTWPDNAPVDEAAEAKAEADAAARTKGRKAKGRRAAAARSGATAAVPAASAETDDETEGGATTAASAATEVTDDTTQEIEEPEGGSEA